MTRGFYLEPEPDVKLVISVEPLMILGGCQNDGPFLDPFSNTAPNIQGTPKGIIILTATHIALKIMQSSRLEVAWGVRKAF